MDAAGGGGGWTFIPEEDTSKLELHFRFQKAYKYRYLSRIHRGFSKNFLRIYQEFIEDLPRILPEYLEDLSTDLSRIVLSCTQNKSHPAVMTSNPLLGGLANAGGYTNDRGSVKRRWG